MDVRIAGRLDGFDAADWIGRKQVRRTDRFGQLLLVASMLAWEDAGPPDVTAEMTATIAATAFGGTHAMLGAWEVGPGGVGPFTIPAGMWNIPSCAVSISLGLRGPNIMITGGIASGVQAIDQAMEMIGDGTADACVVGATDAALLPVVLAGMVRMGLATTSRDPAACRPFDARRDGAVVGEGACALVLEGERPGSDPAGRAYAEVAGAAVVVSPVFAPSLGRSETTTAAMREALERAGESPDEVGYVNAHADGTKQGDAREVRAITRVFGGRRLPVSSSKSMTGHLLSAAATTEVAATALALRHGLLPPTTNYEVPDPACDVDAVPNQARRADVRLAVSNSVGATGEAGAVVLRRAGSG